MVGITAAQADSVALSFTGNLADAFGVGRRVTDGLDPALRPASQRDPSLERDLKAARAAATGAPGALTLAAGGTGIADRILRKRLVSANDAVATMLRSVSELEKATRAYNHVALAKDPGLFGEIRRLAEQKELSGPQVVARILDTKHPDPECAALRPRMRNLARDPEMEARLREIHEIARRFEDRADVVCRMIDRLDGGKPTQGALKAVQGLNEIVGKGLQGPVAALPALAAGVPASVDSSPVGRISAAVGEMSARGAALNARFAAAAGAAMRR